MVPIRCVWLSLVVVFTVLVKVSPCNRESPGTNKFEAEEEVRKQRVPEWREWMVSSGCWERISWSGKGIL